MHVALMERMDPVQRINKDQMGGCGIGLAADTEEAIRRTVAYAKQLNTFVAQFHIPSSISKCNTSFPGTKVYDDVKDTIVDHQWEHYDSFTPVFRHPTLSTGQLLQLKQEAFVSYYFRAGYLRKHGRPLFRVLTTPVNR